MFRFLALLIVFAVAATVKGQTVATLLRGDSLSNAGNYAEAIEAYKEVSEKKGIPGSWRLRALTGMAYCNKPKSVIRISQCCMAVRNPLSFPIWKGMTALFLKTVQDKGYACLLSCPNKLVLISIHNGWS